MNVVIIISLHRFLNISVGGLYYKVNGDALAVTWSGQGLAEDMPGEAKIALFVCAVTANSTARAKRQLAVAEECYSNSACTMAGDYEHAMGAASVDPTNAAYPATEGLFAFCIMDAQVVEFLMDSCFHFFFPGYGYYYDGGDEGGDEGGEKDDKDYDKDCNATLTFDYSEPFEIHAPILLTTPSQGECLASGDALFEWESEVVDEVRVSICTALSSNASCATNPACTFVGYGAGGGGAGGRANATLNVRSYTSNELATFCNPR